MAVKGTLAKENITNKIIQALGNDYIGEFDKKLYAWADDGGNKIQVSIALTCPKVYRGVEETSPSVLYFDDDEESSDLLQGSGFQPAEITQEEQDTLAELMAKLGF